MLTNESDPLELQKCEDYLATEQDNYSTFLEFIRDRLGVVINVISVFTRPSCTHY